MDIQELKQFESVYQPSKEIAFCWGVKKYVQLCLEEDYTHIVDHANDSLRIWQAAKAQAVSEGYVLVSKTPSLKVLDRLYAEHDIDEERAVYIYRDIAEILINEMGESCGLMRNR